MNKMFKKGLRHVCKSKYNAHTEPLLIKENMIKLEDMYKISCIKLMHKKFHKTLHAYHTTKMKSNYELPGRYSKFQDDIKIVGPTRKLSKENSLNFKVGLVWNGMDKCVRNKIDKSMPTFIRHVKKMYISKYSAVCSRIDCYICSI